MSAHACFPRRQISRFLYGRRIFLLFAFCPSHGVVSSCAGAPPSFQIRRGSGGACGRDWSADLL
ncbi:hypothetical protein M758_3G012100 [Ceratodon purpureus]|nr:hypothetical protein M758_3G012100 [Ceratodon purpureus]